MSNHRPKPKLKPQLQPQFTPTPSSSKPDTLRLRFHDHSHAAPGGVKAFSTGISGYIEILDGSSIDNSGSDIPAMLPDDKLTYNLKKAQLLVSQQLLLTILLSHILAQYLHPNHKRHPPLKEFAQKSLKMHACTALLVRVSFCSSSHPDSFCISSIIMTKMYLNALTSKSVQRRSVRLSMKQ